MSVVYVGGGRIGLIAALGLARRGIEVVVLERGAGPVDAPRAASYQYCVMDVFEDVGILEDVLAAGIRVTINNIRYRPTGEVLTTDNAKLADIVRHPFNVNLGQDALSRIVLAHLNLLPNAEVRWGAEVVGIVDADDRPAAVLGGGETVRGDWLLGADGARSTVRKAVGLGFGGFTWEDRFVATNVRYPFGDHGYGASNMVLDPELGCIVAQLESDLWRVTFAEDAGLPEEEIPARIDAFMRRFLPGDEPYALVAYLPYRMHQRSAESYRVGHVLLAGDAAHATNPTGALGLTTGLLDLDVLTPALAAVIEGRADASALDQYASSRRSKFLEHTSPFASDFKRLVYGGDAAALQGAFEGWRSMLDSDEQEIEFLLGIQAIRSEQVV